MSDERSQFLDAFRVEFANLLPAENVDTAPFSVAKETLTALELEGACLDWSFKFLASRNCPIELATYVSRQVSVGVLAKVEQRDESTDAECFARQVFSELVRVCHNIKLSSLLNHHQILPEISVHAIKNTRRKMEDRHVVLPLFGQLVNNSRQASFYAVFDGHGGVDAAQYAATHLHCALARHLRTAQLSTAQSLRQAFIDTDTMFGVRAKQERLSSGSTAVCVLVEPSELHVAWLGDSQATLVHNTQTVTLVDPHKPERQDERERIEAAGGCVVFIGAWRVNGTLSVSRAIGDVSYKPFVSGEPDVATFPYSADDWLVLACDGLWDTLTSVEVAEVINDGDQSTVAQRLVRLAKERGSSDNITALAVKLSHMPQNDTNIAGNVSTRSSGHADKKFNSDGNSGGGNSHDRNSNRSSSSGNPSVSGDRVNVSTENSRLALGLKCSAEMELEDEMVGGPETMDREDEASCSSDVQRCSQDSDVQRCSQDSARNVFTLSKVDSLEEALMSVTGIDDFSPLSSGLSDIVRTTSEDTSGQSPDTSGELSHSGAAAALRRRSRRRSNHGFFRQKENKRPSSDGGEFANETPPCLQHGSPIPCGSESVHVHSFQESSCRSHSLASSGPLVSGLIHLAGGAQRGNMVRSAVESRGLRSTVAPSRWTIAVEVDADGGEFETSVEHAADKIPAVMNLSSHW